MKITLSQMRVKSTSMESNFKTIQTIVTQALQNETDILVLPEMCLTGYFVGDEWERESFLRDAETLGQAIANLSTQKLHIIFGNVGVDWNSHGEDGRVRKYNALFHAHNKQLSDNPALKFPFWPKTLLPNYREFDDSRYFYDLRKLALDKNCSIGELISPLIIQDGDQERWTIGLGICEDAWTYDYNFSVFDALSQKFSIDLFLSINGSPYTFGKIEKRDKVFGALATRTQIPILHTNCTGTQNIGKTIYGFDGSCGAINKHGTIVFKGEAFASENYVFNVFKTNNETIIAPISKQTAPSASSRISEIRLALEATLANLLQEWNIKRVVIGASGGIDSAVAAVLFARTLGSSNVFLVNMPSQFNSALTKNAAEKLATNLQCPYAIFSIEDGVKKTLIELQKIKFSNTNINLHITPITNENIQARDRGGRILAAIASALGAVFSCNANKAETTVGYSTLYGDLGGFLSPLADLWKHDIYALAYHYNSEIFQREIIPSDTLHVKPSAELSLEQDVTQGKGDPLVYEYHDFLFKAWVESWHRRCPYELLKAYQEHRVEDLIKCESNIVRKLFPTAKHFIADLERWWNLYQGMGAVKRMQAPPVLAVSQRAFGFDHRESLHPPRYSLKYEELKKQLLS